MELIKYYKVAVNSVIHVGAHFGQEVKDYVNNGVEKGVFIEADPETFITLKRNIEPISNYEAVNSVLSSEPGKNVNFYQSSNNGLSSSILKPKGHLIEHPGVKFSKSIKLTTDTLDTLGLDASDLIVIDAQGNELEILRGGKNLIQFAKALWIEVSIGGLYEDDSRVEDVIEFCSSYGYRLVNLVMNTHLWGDALFLKNDYLNYDKHWVHIQDNPILN